MLELELALALELELALELALELELEQAQGPERVMAPALAAPGWVLDQGQVRVQVDLDPVAVRDRTAMALAMEPAMTVSVPQTVQALARATAPARAGMHREEAGNNANPLGLPKGSPHPDALSDRWL
jgi:hypothetical protein